MSSDQLPSAQNPQPQYLIRLNPEALAALSNGRSSAPAPEQAPEQPSIDFAGLWQALRRRWWIVLGATALATGLAYAYATKSPKIYASTGTFLVQQRKSEILPGSTVQPGDAEALEDLKTLENALVSSQMILRVAHDCKLREDPTFLPPRAEPYADAEIVAILGKNVKSELKRGTRLIEITVEDTDPARAKRLADSFMVQANLASSEVDSAASRGAKDILEVQLKEIGTKLEASKKAVADFRAQYPTFSFVEKASEMKSTLMEDRLKSLNSEVASAKLELVKLASASAQVKQYKSGDALGLLKIQAIAQLEEIVALLDQLHEAEESFALADARYKPAYEKHKAARDRLLSVQTSLREALLKAAAGIENRQIKATNDLASLEAELTALRKENQKYEIVAGEFEQLSSELNANRKIYDEILDRSKQTAVGSSLGDSLLRIESTPLEPVWPIRPRRMLMTALGSVLGFCGGLALVLGLRMLDRKLRTLEQGESELRLPGLAAVPRVRGSSLRQLQLTMPGCSEQTGEAFRALRASLALLGKGPVARTFLFTSANSDEGKSYCAMNHAIALAQQGYRTLLIDGDMRQPSLDAVFLGRINPVGLANHLQGMDADKAAKACNPTSIANLHLFSAGRSAEAHPGEILTEQAFRSLLEDAMKWFHKIVIDTPPVNAVADALFMARHVDSVCFVVHGGKTTKADAKRAVAKLSAAGARPVGFVLNGAAKEALCAGYTGQYSGAQHSMPRLDYSHA